MTHQAPSSSSSTSNRYSVPVNGIDSLAIAPLSFTEDPADDDDENEDDVHLLGSQQDKSLNTITTTQQHGQGHLLMMETHNNSNSNNNNNNPSTSQVRNNNTNVTIVTGTESDNNTSTRPSQQQRQLQETNLDDDDDQQQQQHSNNNQDHEQDSASVITITDRYGFIGSSAEDNSSNEPPHLPSEVIAARELKWLHMLSRWDHTMKHDFKRVRSRCRKGIPRSVRGRAWFYLCGAAYLSRQNPTTFHDLLAQDGKLECIEDIRKDVHRQFPNHELFSNASGQEELFRVLKAYSNLNLDEGYCQAHAPIAATLLMHMPTEDAFWCMVALCGKYLKGYYSPGMTSLKLDGDILFGLLKRVSPSAVKHLKAQKIDPILYMTEWFLCAFTRTLPWSSVLRVWDMFLCEGIKILFRTGLVLLKYTIGQAGIIKNCPTMYETLSVIKNIPHWVSDERFLVYQLLRLNVTDDQMRKEHTKQLLKRKKAEKKEKGKNATSSGNK